MAKLIALYAGAPQSGKTTVANHLVQKHDFTQVKFAGVLKTMVYTMLRAFKDDPEWAYACIEGDQKEVPLKWLGGKSPRDLMVTLGTDWGRELITPDIWLTACRAATARHLRAGRSVVIDDMRFPNEYACLQLFNPFYVEVWVSDEVAPELSATEGLLVGHTFDWGVHAPRGDVQYLLDEVDVMVGVNKLASVTY